jgi:hypothetical protein
MGRADAGAACCVALSCHPDGFSGDAMAGKLGVDGALSGGQVSICENQAPGAESAEMWGGDGELIVVLPGGQPGVSLLEPGSSVHTVRDRERATVQGRFVAVWCAQ